MVNVNDVFDVDVVCEIHYKLEVALPLVLLLLLCFAVDDDVFNVDVVDGIEKYVRSIPSLSLHFL